ncbi:unnamed protein product [Hermetia illucens]|uniref:G-protein coupled receptors family 2 profile 2 domain-containing protein n=1 Tax=Hermetia illucens TaxID=343691 RepID=A0A7R8Z0L8_HERIL|nr:probable G-protein coupled receptor Mth-like 5 [Hermetia illucens]XP_037921980.1 probable G-protein coupled receptor Mth-like 5 [Hermetia illucens]CAD7092554.1 unnamed protein product [Hermetia illucens]
MPRQLVPVFHQKVFVPTLTRIAFVLLFLGNHSSSQAHLTDKLEPIRVNKCCEKFEVLLDSSCTHVNETHSEPLQPVFTNENGQGNIQVNYKFVIGKPACSAKQSWPIYHYPGSSDELVLLEDGKLRHYTQNPASAMMDTDLETDKKPIYYDHVQGQYCLEIGYSTTGDNKRFMFAMVCSPEKVVRWTDTDFLLRKIINPIFHGISIVILLIVAIIYFILPTLRDLIGNIITTITICLIVSQAADLVRIFTEFSSHVSFLVADTILYVSLLAAFFWLNSFGYYIWKTFRSRNVFLRVTDGRKYCWYSGYAWGMTFMMAGLAVFAHFFLDSDSYRKNYIIENQETIGWLGIAIFFTPIACSIIIDIFFYVTTLKLINRRNVYGRIQHKLKSNFIMYSLILIIMSVAWLFFILSWLRFDALLYVHMFINAIQAPLILYVCVIRQKHVTFLLKKSCCYNEPPSNNDWGDELHYMNDGDF